MTYYDYKAYSQREASFFKKHQVANVYEQGDWQQRTKHYICEDGAELWEDIRVEYLAATATCKAYGCEFIQCTTIAVLVTEVWDTDDSNSGIFCEVIKRN